MFQARAYQTQAVEDIKATYANGCKRVFYTLATGGGKTHIFSEIIKRAMTKRKNVLVIAHRAELVSQAVNKLKSHGVNAKALTAGKLYENSGSDECTVAMIQTLRSWAASGKITRIKVPNLIIIDEAHLATSPSYEQILGRFPDAYRLLVSATPWRLDGSGFDHLVDKLLIGPQTKELIQGGYLVQPVTYSSNLWAGSGAEIKISSTGEYDQKQLEDASNTTLLNGHLVENYEAHGEGAMFMVSTTGIKHSLNVKALFEEAGYRIAHVDGKTPKNERAQIFRDAERGNLDGITNCKICVEGIDIPRIGCWINARPTKSLSDYLQAAGRTIRLFPGKTKTLILDSANGVKEHGLIEDHRDWNLEGRKKQERKKKEAALKKVELCPACGYDYEGHKRDYYACIKCGYPFVLDRQVDYTNELLEMVDTTISMSDIRRRYESIRVKHKAKGHKKYAASAWHTLYKQLLTEGMDDPIFILSQTLGPSKIPYSIKMMEPQERAYRYPSRLWS